VGGAPFGAAGAADVSSGGRLGFGVGLGLAVGPYGAVSLGWTRASGGQLGMTAMLSRFAPGQTTAAAAPLSNPSSTLVSLALRLGAAPDGSLLAGWLQLEGLSTLSIAGARVAPDGTIGPARSTMTSVSLAAGFSGIRNRCRRPTATEAGSWASAA